MDDALLAPPDQEWRRISPEYTTVLRVRMLVSVVVVAGATAAALWLLTDWRWAAIPVAAGLIWAVWQWFRLARWVRTWGYAEHDEDLYLTHGLWFRELTVIPYGRMQAVKVESGPLTRARGLASVELVTASLQSSAKIPGLPRADAEQLRDRLTAIGIGDEDGL
ncbi:MAG: PH domain-containing protein [Micropruina sp.]|uniref:PH domain-containing protein n=1 Tax=Micropruina sp. TaxID=2737536 RepID=UPI0039E459E3